MTLITISVTYTLWSGQNVMIDWLIDWLIDWCGCQLLVGVRSQVRCRPLCSTVSWWEIRHYSRLANHSSVISMMRQRSQHWPPVLFSLTHSWLHSRHRFLALSFCSKGQPCISSTPWVIGKQDTKLLSISLPNIDGFSNFSHCYTQRKICSKMITADPNTHQSCHYTTLWNTDFQKLHRPKAQQQ